jgi:hypothetical protein
VLETVSDVLGGVVTDPIDGDRRDVKRVYEQSYTHLSLEQ